MIRVFKLFYTYLLYAPMVGIISNETNSYLYIRYEDMGRNTNHFAQGGLYLVNYFISMITTYFAIAYVALWIVSATYLLFKKMVKNYFAISFFAASCIFLFYRFEDYLLFY